MWIFIEGIIFAAFFFVIAAVLMFWDSRHAPWARRRRD